METLQERWISNEKVIRRVIKSLKVEKDEDIKEKVDQFPKANNSKKLKIKPKVRHEKPKKTKSSPAVVADGALIFSKFDLVQSSDKQHTSEEKRGKKIGNLKKSLKKLKYHEGKISKLVEAKETEKVDEIRHGMAWKNALEKAEGKKVFDDPKRLERSLKKHKKSKIKHAKEWADRKKEVQKKINKRQEKRERNINKKIMLKKKKKKTK